VGYNGNMHSCQDENQSIGNKAEKLRKDLIYIGESFKNLSVFKDRTNALFNALKERSSFDNLLTENGEELASGCYPPPHNFNRSCIFC
jgi:hypothetical protein